MESELTLRELIQERRIRTPAVLYAIYKGRPLSARISRDGTVEFGGHKYNSLSVAAGVAIVQAGAKPSKGRRYRHVNGWTFWRIEVDGLRVPMARLR
ncbi:MAG TPA: hypothetical protein VGC20_08725 [bacterium]